MYGPRYATCRRGHFQERHDAAEEQVVEAGVDEGEAGDFRTVGGEDPLQVGRPLRLRGRGG
jgi:hypothetical protein